MKGPFKFLKVTTTKYYIVPMATPEKSTINGWTLLEIIEDWFKRFPLWGRHATREAYTVGGIEELVSAEIVDKLP